MIAPFGARLGRMPAALFLCLTALHFQLPGSDWPQYRGPNRNGVTSEPVAATWPGTQPAVG